jgi:hypothetical protein
MSILNAWVERERAWVGVDSDLFAADGERLGSISKMVPLVHANAVLAFRGQYAVFAMIHSMIVWQPVGFDDLLKLMPGLLKSAVEQTETAITGMPGAPPVASLPMLDLVLVGFSRRQARMVGFFYSYVREKVEFVGAEIPLDTGFFAPGDEAFLAEITAARLPGTIEEKMIATAKRQMVFARDRHPVAATGGRFFVAHLARGAMMITDAADLGAAV